MQVKSAFRWIQPGGLGAFLFSLVLFCLILLFRIPYSFSQYFRSYSVALFLLVLLLYFLAFRSPDRYRQLACFGLTMLLFALALSFKWNSGHSDSNVIAGFLPYKDGAGYYYGASLILHGLPLENTLQAGWRPLFSGFLSSLLFLLGGNLKIVLAILVFLAGTGTWFAARQVYGSFGPLPASLFITFLYFYIQPNIGLTMTELLGFAMGCFAFSILWLTAMNPRWTDLVIGLIVLVLAVSVRAGTFFILPLMAIWAGRIFRGSRNFSWRALGVALLTILLVYFAANSLYPRWVGVPEGKVLGNFSYSLYGQVQGGTGWHRAIEELGTRDPSIIYRAAFQFFLQHPLSLFIGIAKSYRDFFLPGHWSMFPFDIYHQWAWINYMIWAAVAYLVFNGLIRLVKDSTSNLSLLLIAGFAGIVFSIPFLPPIDGGPRFYASTAPFFFIVPAIGLAGLSKTSKKEIGRQTSRAENTVLRIGSIVLAFLTIGTPLMIFHWNPVTSVSAPGCPSGEEPFVIKIYPGSYVDLIAEGNRCGLVPEICLSDFYRNGTERSVDDFYQRLYALARESESDVRVFPAVNFVDGRLRYFLMARDVILEDVSAGLLSGCALENKTKNQSIYQVQSIFSNGE